MEFLSFVSFLLFIVYIITNLYTRFYMLSENYRKHILYFIFFSIFFAIIYIFNVYMFNQGNSLSYGSDSSYFENIFVDMSRYHFSSLEYEIIVNEGKSFTFFLFYPIYAISSDYLLNSLILFLINYIIYLLTAITALLLILDIFPNRQNHLTKYYLIYFFPVFLISFSFLRDVYNLFFVIEIAYLLFLSNKIFIYRWGLILLGIFSLLYIRDFFAYVIALYIVLHFTKKGYKLLIFLGLSATIIFLLPHNELMHIFGKLLILTSGDVDSVASKTDAILDITTFYNGGYSIATLLNYVVDRLSIGSIRMILTPLFAQYILFFDSSFIPEISYTYMGFDYKLILVLNSFLYNFFLFPMIISFFMTFKDNYKISTEVQKNFYIFFLIILFAIISIYSIKFYGSRNNKIDFLFQFFWLIILSLQQIKRKYFLIGLTMMIVLNLIYGYQIFHERLI